MWVRHTRAAKGLWHSVGRRPDRAGSMADFKRFEPTARLGRAAGLSLALHLALLAGLGSLARRSRALPPIEMDDNDVVQVSPLEVPVPANMPAWPTAGGPQGNVVKDNDGQTGSAAVVTPAPAPTARPLEAKARPPARPEKALAQAAPTPPTGLAPAPEGAVARPESRPIAPTPAVTPPAPKKAKDAPHPTAVADAAAERPDAGSAASTADASDVGTNSPSAVVPTAEEPTSGVIGVGAVGGSPLALFVGQLNNQVRGQWRAKEVYGRLDPRGRLGGAMFSTILDVRIRGDGTLERVKVISSSGSPELDAEAVETFKRGPQLPRPPAPALDAAGGYDLKFGLHLDVATFHFQAQAQRIILEGWRGSPAFNRAGDHARITLARMLLTKDGQLVRALVLGSAGIDFLDEGVLKALPPDLKLPVPPPAYIRHPGLVPVDVEFIHNVHIPSGVRVLRPLPRGETK
jgi:TonB family protein